MTWSIDHIAIVAHDLGRSLTFYEEVLDTKATPIEFTSLPNIPSQPRAVLLDHVGSSIHLIQPLPNFHCEWPEIPLNVTAPHIALTVPDSHAVMARLEAIKWLYLSPQNWGPVGYDRLYTNDPSMNTVEASQVVKPDVATTGLARVRGVAEDEALNDAGWTLDQLFLSAFNLDETRNWFSTFIGVEPPVAEGPNPNGKQPFAVERSIFFEEEGMGRGLTFAEPSAGSIGELWVDTVAHSYFGLAVKGLDAVARRLENSGTDFSAIRDALYFRDPSMNLIRATDDPV